MARIKTIEGNGLTLSYNTTSGGSGGSGTLVGGVTGFTGGGYTREMLDDTDLSNAGWTTKVGAALKTADDITVEVKALAALPPETNLYWTMTCGTISLSFWGQISASGSPAFSNATPATRSITITPTNLDASGAESGPVLTFGA